MDLNGTYEKRPLRAAARAYRDQLDAASRTDADRVIASRIVASAAFAEAPAVMAYYAVGTEVDTRAIISTALEAGKTVALPRCRRGGLMDWHRIAALTDVAPGYGGIPEPADDPSTLIDAAALPPTALALVPGLLFDDAGFRLGYGGGFYDRFLAAFPGRAIGLIRARQRIESLADHRALEPFDRPVSYVVTEEDGLTIP